MRFLSNKEKKELALKLPNGYEINKKDIIKEDGNLIYLDDDKFLIIDKIDKKNNNYLPHLKSIPKEFYKIVKIDRGAIPFIIKGADLMRPGIRFIDDGINKDDIVMVVDEEHNKLLALGFSLFNSEEMKEQKTGKSIKIYHYFNDEFY